MVVLSWVESYPGMWTARLCRMINAQPETEESIIWCGQCVDYANPRKRARAKRWAEHPTLPGFEPPYQLHGLCGPIGLTRLRHMLYKLRDRALMIVSEQNAIIPDVRQARGWDFATRWWPT